MYRDLVQYCEQGALFITATRRLALMLKDYFSQHFLAKQRSCALPEIFAYQDWLASLWAQFEASGQSGTWQLLTPTQEIIIWEHIIQQQPATTDLLRPEATARLLSQTWALICQWQLGLTTIESQMPKDHHIFMDWCLSFQQQLAQQHYLENARLSDKLLQLAHQNLPRFSAMLETPAIILLGFNDMPPQQCNWLDFLSAQGWRVHTHQLPHPLTQSVQKTEFATQEQELLAVAHWAKSLNLRHPTASIGIVVPDLTQVRQQVDQCFSQVLAPMAELKANSPSGQYNISAALGLGHYPIIYAALEAFKLLNPSIGLQSAQFLLRAPFFYASDQEHSERAALAKALQQLDRPNLSLKQWIACGRKQDSTLLWINLLEGLLNFKSAMPKVQLPSAWGECFNGLLSHLDWPGQRSLNSIEHQAVEKFYALIQELDGLDNLLGQISYPQALARLKKMSLQTPFQPQAKAEKIQILGALEASGLRFDYLWITGTHNEAWPAVPNPNPVLPFALQKQLGMPHADANRELYFAKSLLNQYIQHSQEVRFSYYHRDNIKTYFESHLIQALPRCPDAELPIILPGLVEQIQAQGTLLQEYDNQAPKVSSKETVQGGHTILSLQAQCPFQAFAQIRLQAKPTEPLSLGCSAKLRGILTHQVLEQIWKSLHSHQQLIRLSDAQLTCLIEQAIHQCFQMQSSLMQTLPSHLQVIERKRLAKVLKAWFYYERQRPPFTVRMQEATMALQLANLPLRLRVDRVDETENGEYLIVDYKTGLSHLADCLGERPNAPQLPLYCLASDTFTPNGLLFAQVHAQGCEFIGVTHQALLNSPKVFSLAQAQGRYGLPPTWPELTQLWKITFEQLAKAFMQGEAKADPKTAQNCQNCHLPQLCRIYSRYG